MQAIILAAGMGKRLKEHTKDVPKCMVEVNGVSLIERILHQLEILHLSKIVLVVGYKAEVLKDFIGTLNLHTPIIYVDNEVYDSTNNIYSLYLAKEHLLDECTLLLESDIIISDGVLEDVVAHPAHTVALVAKYESWMDGTVVTLDSLNNISKFIDKSHFNPSQTSEYYKTVNIYKLDRDFSKKYYVPLLTLYTQMLGVNDYYEQVFRIITLLTQDEIFVDSAMGAEIINDIWYEIDNENDLMTASELFKGEGI